MSTQPIKVASEEYTNGSFHLIQSNGPDKRYVVFLNDKVRIRMLLAGFINQSKKEIQVKVRDLDNPDKPIEYSGVLGKSRLHELITKHEDVIFHNGYHELMVRNSDSGDYVAFDEHGLLFIYTTQDYSEILKNLEAEYRQEEKLINEFNHLEFPFCA